MKLCPGDCKNQLGKINMRVDKENGKDVEVANGGSRKLWRFSRNEFRKNIGCPVSAHTFGLGGSRLLYKE